MDKLNRKSDPLNFDKRYYPESGVYYRDYMILTECPTNTDHPLYKKAIEIMCERLSILEPKDGMVLKITYSLEDYPENK